MADSASVEAQLTAIPDVLLQKIFKGIFRYILTTTTFGRATAGGGVSAVSPATPSINLVGGFFVGVTAGVANQEFAVQHNFGRAPYLVIPVLPLDTTGAAIVRLSVSRAADAVNVYLKSPDTSQTIYLYIEG